MKVVKYCKMLLFMAAAFIILPNYGHASESTSNSASENVNPFSAVTPQPVYVEEEVRHYKTSQYDIPPAIYPHSRMINGLRYSGNLTRHSYANAGEYWIVIYKCWITAD